MVRPQFENEYTGIAQGIQNAAQAISGYFQQRAQQRTADEELFNRTKMEITTSVQQQLASPYLPESERAQLQEQLRYINMATNQDELMGVFYGAPESTTVVPGQPMEALPSGARTVGAPEVTVTTQAQPGVAQDVAEAQAAATRAERSYLNTQNQFQFIQQLAAAPDVDPEQRQALVRNFLGGIDTAHLDDGQTSTLMAIAGYTDPNALNLAIAQARTGQATATRAEVEADIAVATRNAAIDQIVATASRAVTEARVAEGTADVRIASAEQQYRVTEENLAMAAEAHAQSMDMNDLRMTQLQQNIDQTGVLFERELAESDLRNVQAALDTGIDAFLTEEQRRATAAAMGLDISNPQDLQSYNQQMQVRRNQAREASEAQLIAAALADDQAALNLQQTAVSIEQTQQNIANARLNFDINTYQFNRSRVMDPLRDAQAFASALNDDAFAGNTQVFDQYIAILENPDLYPEQSAKLREMGYTVEGLTTMKGVASSERARIINDADVRSDLLAGQATQLARANQQQATAIINDVASYYDSEEDFNADRARLKELRYTDDEINAIGRQVRLNSVLPASDRLDALTKVVPDEDSYGDWRANFEAVAVEAGFTETDASIMADGFINAFTSTNQATELDRQVKDLQRRRLIVEVDALENPVPEDSPLALSVSDQLSALTGQRLATQQLQATDGCMPPSSLAELVVQEVITQAEADQAAQKYVSGNRDESACANHRRVLEDINRSYSEMTGVYTQAVGTPPAGAMPESMVPQGAPAAEPMQIGDVTIAPEDVDLARSFGPADDATRESIRQQLFNKYGEDVSAELVTQFLNVNPTGPTTPSRSDTPLFPSESAAPQAPRFTQPNPFALQNIFNESGYQIGDGAALAQEQQRDFFNQIFPTGTSLGQQPRGR